MTTISDRTNYNLENETVKQETIECHETFTILHTGKSLKTLEK